MRSGSARGGRSWPPLAQCGGTFVVVVPELPEPHPGAASRNHTSQIATTTIRARTQLRARPARTAAAVSVHPDVHDGVPVRAVPRDARMEVSLCPRIGRVGTDPSTVAVLVGAVAADVPVEGPAEARVRRPPVTPEIGDQATAPAPTDLLVVAEDDKPGEIAPRGPCPARPAGAR